MSDDEGMMKKSSEGTKNVTERTQKRRANRLKRDAHAAIELAIAKSINVGDAGDHYLLVTIPRTPARGKHLELTHSDGLSVSDNPDFLTFLETAIGQVDEDTYDEPVRMTADDVLPAVETDRRELKLKRDGFFSEMLVEE